MPSAIAATIIQFQQAFFTVDGPELTGAFETHLILLA